ncbi:hypothetical protein M885DRAFT_558058 [Pelagophyceae sp. CCMP2097]|nr:hypothetical protein M885DRAFT_558058 [Pelagophyceae sp. CCMP2097]
MAAKRCLSLTSWFKIPEQMKMHEVLARGSAFAVHRSGNDVVVLASAHVVAPWRYRKYYNVEWIQYINPKDCRYSVETRGVRGNVLDIRDVRLLAIHGDRDVAALGSIKFFQDKDVAILDILSLETAANAEIGDLLYVDGHNICAEPPKDESPDAGFMDHLIQGEARGRARGWKTKHTEPRAASEFGSPDDDRRVLVPSVVHGVVTEKSQTQTFAKTKEAGIIEGIVPTELDHELASQAAFIVASAASGPITTVIAAPNLVSLIEEAARKLADREAIDDPDRAFRDPQLPPQKIGDHDWQQ